MQGPMLPPTQHLDTAAILSAAFDLLDEQGLERVTLRRLAIGIGIDQATLRHSFSRRTLLAAMTERMLAEQPLPAPAYAIWQDCLRHRALSARRAMRSRRDGALLMAVHGASRRANGETCLVALGMAGFTRAAAEGALDMIDCVTLGAVLRECGPPSAEAEARFGERIAALIASLSPDGVAATQAPSLPRHHIDHLRLWETLRIMRESAAIGAARMIGLAEFDCRFLALLQHHGRLSSTQIAASLGVDKAHVSRTVKRLEGLDLIDRGSLRSPLALSAGGAVRARRMLQLAELHDRELTFGIDDPHVADFLAIGEELTARAILLVERERRSRGNADEPADKGGADPIVPGQARILPALLRLSSHIRRSRALMVKRLSGLSHSEVRVLTILAHCTRLDWDGLLEAVDRDQSQAWRMTRRLIETGMVERSGPPARRHGIFALSAEGRRLHAAIEETAHEHSAFLLATISAERLDRFAATLQAIARNAEGQRDRERALGLAHRSDQRSHSITTLDSGLRRTCADPADLAQKNGQEIKMSQGRPIEAFDLCGGSRTLRPYRCCDRSPRPAFTEIPQSRLCAWCVGNEHTEPAPAPAPSMHQFPNRYSPER